MANFEPIYGVFFVIADIIATGWLLRLFSTLYLEPARGIPRMEKHAPALNWRNVLFTLCTGVLLSIGGRTVEWAEIFRPWRIITSLLVFFAGLMLIMGRVFNSHSPTTLAAPRYISTVLGWLFLAMFILDLAMGSGR